MTRYIVLLAFLAACAPKSERADSVDAAIPAIDTLKPVTTSDTLLIATDSVVTGPADPATKSKTAPLQTKTPPATTRPRDSAFSPPRKLPQLDTVKKKPD